MGSGMLDLYSRSQCSSGECSPCGAWICSALISIRTHLRGSVAPDSGFVVRGPYRWVRHPWYAAAIVLFWSNTDLTADRLLFNLLWTVWVCVGARLEEKDLLAQFGTIYGEYRRQVPMLVPWRGRAMAE